MLHGALDDLAAFACVDRLRNFKRAAAKLGTSMSNLSHTIRRLEQRLGTRLLQRNSRSVAPSEAGTALLETLRPAQVAIESALDALDRKQDAVAGTVRLTAPRQAYDQVIRHARSPRTIASTTGWSAPARSTPGSLGARGKSSRCASPAR